jgi:hypothetical protein
MGVDRRHYHFCPFLKVGGRHRCEKADECTSPCMFALY